MYKQVLDPVGDSLFAERDSSPRCRWSRCSCCSAA